MWMVFMEWSFVLQLMIEIFTSYGIVSLVKSKRLWWAGKRIGCWRQGMCTGCYCETLLKIGDLEVEGTGRRITFRLILRRYVMRMRGGWEWKEQAWDFVCLCVLLFKCMTQTVATEFWTITSIYCHVPSWAI